MKLFLLCICAVQAEKIAWTLSKPPANLFRWETSKENPSYTLSSLSEGDFVLQAIAMDESGQSTHSGVVQGEISKAAMTINLVLNPLIQADATRFQQPSYVQWVKTNTTTVYPGDIVKLTIKGKSNPPDSTMQYTIDDVIKCTTKDMCITTHKIPNNVDTPYRINIAIVGMGYSIPMEFMVKEYVPVTFRATFNSPPEITAINSGISLLHQIGTSTTVSASFTDEQGSNIKYTWSTEAIQGSCQLSELSGTITGTAPSGSTVSVVFTPTTLGNKCMIKIRCEDIHGAVSLGEAYIYVDSVPLYYPPYVVSKLQSKQVAEVGEKVHLSLEMCEPQDQMISVKWTSTCGSLNHVADTLTEPCEWIYNDIILQSLPCSVAWTATDTDGTISSGKFRILEKSRRLSEAKIQVKTSENSLTTIMYWPKTSEDSDAVEEMTGEGVALIVVCTIFFLSIVLLGILWKRRGSHCVQPIEPKQTPEHVNPMTLKSLSYYKDRRIKRKSELLPSN